ncbi:MAG TPA: ureidoglycolate lyase [Aliidongia sp.]|nr:ureidoglycolate lyase [Aliidongia sp.]
MIGGIRRSPPIILTLVSQALTPARFAPFGQMIDERAVEPLAINDGATLRFDDLARIEIESGRPRVSLFRNPAAITLPYRLPLLECHPLGSQAFIPRTNAPFLIVVAEPGPAPALDRLAAFLTDGHQGVNYRPGTWHLPLASLVPAEFIVIDRGGPGENCRIFRLDEFPIEVAQSSGGACR